LPKGLGEANGRIDLAKQIVRGAVIDIVQFIQPEFRRM
jgi:hypothetical protein